MLLYDLIVKQSNSNITHTHTHQHKCQKEAMNLKVMTERHGMGVEMKDPGDTGGKKGKGAKT